MLGFSVRSQPAFSFLDGPRLRGSASNGMEGNPHMSIELPKTFGKTWLPTFSSCTSQEDHCSACPKKGHEFLLIYRMSLKIRSSFSTVPNKNFHPTKCTPPQKKTTTFQHPNPPLKPKSPASSLSFRLPFKRRRDSVEKRWNGG